jgi:oxygen-dependent protoporphyrinogen oxidase
MLGALDPESRHVSIVGAGFAGLVAALTLAKKGYQVVIYEQESQPGGMLLTERIGGFTIEHAANSLVISPAMSRLCADVGVRLHIAAKGQHAKYIVRDRQARRFPPLSYFEWLEALAIFFRTCWARDDIDASLGSWVEKHFGKKVLEYVVAPVITGVFACSPYELSMRALFTEYGSRRLIGKGFTYGMQRIFAAGGKDDRPFGAVVEGGMKALVQAIHEKLQDYPNVKIRLGVECSQLPQSGNICLCVPAYKAADFIAPVCSVSARMLRAIRYSPLISASLIIPREAFRQLPSGTGILFPAGEQRGVLGILFSSIAYPHVGGGSSSDVLLRAFLGGTQNAQILDLSEDEVRKIVLSEIDTLWGIKDSPACEWRIHYWPRAIPVYSAELFDTWNSLPWIRTRGHVLFSSYTGRVSLRGMLESVESL